MKFKTYPLGYFHVDIAEAQTAEGKLYLFVAIDRTSKFAYVELHPKAGKMAAAAFLRNLIAAVPYRVHIVLTDNCSVPDDHIDPRRSAFFMARSVLRNIRNGVRPC